MKYCSTSKIDKETEHIQQMHYMEEEQTSLKTFMTDTYDSLNEVTSIGEI